MDILPMQRKQKAAKQRSKVPPELLSLAKEIVRVKKEAEALGLFVDDRELLECNKCGLAEGVTIEGVLVTYHRESIGLIDTGLRFEKVGDTTFRCPICRTRLKATML